MGPLRGGKNIIILFDMNGGILVGGFKIAFVLSMRKRKKYLRPREKTPSFYNSVVKEISEGILLSLCTI